jgi:hypothetical protein
VWFPDHIAVEKTDAYPPVNDLPTVEAKTARKVVAKLAREGKLPAAGGQFWVRIVLENDGTTAKAMSAAADARIRSAAELATRGWLGINEVPTS